MIDNAEKERNKNMSKVKDENYISISGWMVTRLGLKGNELLIYAIIYGFSQDGETRFTGSLQYLADWTNSTKQSCIKCLKSLVEKGYIEKEEKIVNGVKFCEYQAVEPRLMVLNKVEHGIKQSLTGGIKQSLTNNIDSNILDNTIESKKERKTKKTPQSYDDQIAEFTDNEELQNALKAFVQMRTFIKKPLTEYAFKLLLSKLSKMGRNDDERISIVNRSVEHNWQGFYKYKEETSNKKPAQPENVTTDKIDYSLPQDFLDLLKQ